VEQKRRRSKRRGVNQMERVRGVKGLEGVIGGERMMGKRKKWE